MRKFNNFIKESNIESSDIKMFDDKLKKVRNFLYKNLITTRSLEFDRDDLITLIDKLNQDKFKEYSNNIDKQIKIRISNYDINKLNLLLKNKKVEKYWNYINNLINQKSNADINTDNSTKVN